MSKALLYFIKEVRLFYFIAFINDEKSKQHRAEKGGIF